MAPKRVNGSTIEARTEFPPDAVAHIVRHLRPRDRVEIFGLRWDDDEAACVRDFCHVAGALWRIWYYDGEPVAMNGVLPIRPGVVVASAFGTDKWRHVIRPMTRWSLNWCIPALQRAGYHRGEAYALALNADGRAWIELLGGKIEAYLEQYGRNQETYILYAWRLNEDVLWRGRRIERSAAAMVHH